MDNVADSWAQEAVEWAVENGILYGDENGNYKLHSYCTRQEMLVFLYRLYELLR
ncbi:MAG: S-layer homology domain-containing protein [Clostridia bacterium]|nr:S-layer homology domain-containing protein [Clostridia bacterium]